VSFNTKVLDEHLPLAFDVLSDLVLNPMFRPEDVEKEKGVILEEIKMDADSPESQAHEIFCKNFWKGHALGKPILGTKESIASFTSESVRDYYERAYTPENIVITSAGNLEHERLVDLCAKAFEGIRRDGRLPATEPPRSYAEISLKSKRSLEQTHMCMGVPAYPMPHEMRFACYLLSAILGGGMSSRLFQNIREKQGLVYTVFSELNLYHDAGCLEIYAGCSPQSTRKVIDSIMHEFRAMKSAPVAADELRRAKDHLKGSLMLSLESTSSRMANLARQHIFFHQFFSLDQLLHSIESVTAEQVHQISNEFFNPDHIALTLLGPLKGFQVTRADLNC
jgi:predicted Zn-dependent peptidase